MTMVQQSGMAQPTMMQSGVAMAMPVAMPMPQPEPGNPIRLHTSIVS
jgi:hypothetical protein